MNFTELHRLSTLFGIQEVIFIEQAANKASVVYLLDAKLAQNKVTRSFGS